MEQQTVTNSAVIHGLRALKLNEHALLAQARPHDDKSSDQSILVVACLK